MYFPDIILLNAFDHRLEYKILHRVASNSKGCLSFTLQMRWVVTNNKQQTTREKAHHDSWHWSI